MSRGFENVPEVGLGRIGRIDLSHGTGNQHALLRSHRCQRDFGTEAAAVLALSIQFQARKQRPRPGRFAVMLAMMHVLFTVLLRHQDLDGLPQQFLRGVSEQRFRAAIEKDNSAFLVRHDSRISCSVQQFVNDLGGQFACGHRGRHETW